MNKLEALLPLLKATAEELNGSLHLAIRDIQTGEELHWRSNERVKTASVIKLPILIHVAQCVAQGNLSWDRILTLTEEEKVAGSGVLTGLTAGLELSLRDVCRLMTVISDNTATNMVIELIGVEAINRGIRSLGLDETTLFRKSYSPDSPNSESCTFGLGVTTACEMLKLLTLLSTNSGLPAEVRSDVLCMLEGQQYRDCLPRFLPPDWKYAGKTGSVDGVRNDVGILTSPEGLRIAISAFTQGLTDLRWTPENEGMMAIGRLGDTGRNLLGSLS